GRPWEKIAARIPGFYQWQVPFGVVSPLQEMALISPRHMGGHGTPQDHPGEGACAARSPPLHHPHARPREPLTPSGHHAARVVAQPLRVLDCCLEADGGCALVLTTGERARDLRQPPVHVLAGAQCAGPAHHHPHDWFAFDRRGWVAAAAERLWGDAGLGPDDVDAAMLYDHFTPMVLVALEDWGFCSPGEGGPFVDAAPIPCPRRP